MQWKANKATDRIIKVMSEQLKYGTETVYEVWSAKTPREYKKIRE